MDRDESLRKVEGRDEPWDIVIIGGGATGTGCALDAASRGYSVLLLEQHDFGKGTSSRSTKLIHGGIRYLRQGHLSLVRRALKERFLLLQNAPHVVNKQAFVIPCQSRRQKAFYGSGLKLYDLAAGNYSIGKSAILAAAKVRELLPSLSVNRLTGGVLYYDAQFDDTGLLIDILQTATTYGATALNYAAVTGLIKSSEGRVTGLKFVDRENRRSYELSTRCVINAGGIFSDQIRQMAAPDTDTVVTFSQGSHVVLDREFLPGDAALLIPETSDHRVMFCIPWNGRLIAGTTDVPVSNADLEPTVMKVEIDLILDTLGRYLERRPARVDVRSVFSGIRPLIRHRKPKNPSSISRDHELFCESGLITITGGKWTTYRRMAADAVDKAITEGGLEPRQCLTADLPIAPSCIAVPRSPDAILDKDRLSREAIIHAVQHEMARTPEDVLARRSRILFLDAREAINMAPFVAKIIAEELSRDEVWVDEQVSSFNSIAENYICTPDPAEATDHSVLTESSP